MSNKNLNSAFDSKANEKSEFNSWKPNKGDNIMGTVKNLDIAGDNNAPVMEISNSENEAVSVWCSNAQLKTVLQKAKYLKDGDWTDLAQEELLNSEIAIRFDGEKKSKGGRLYNTYTVLLEKDLIEAGIIKKKS